MVMLMMSMIIVSLAGVGYMSKSTVVSVVAAGFAIMYTNQLFRTWEVQKQITRQSLRYAFVIHEIMNQIHVINGLASLHKEQESQGVDNVDCIISAALTVRRLVEDILTNNRISRSTLVLAPIPTSIPKMINNLVASWSARASESGIILSAIVNGPFPSKLTLDNVRVVQMASNLLSNAIKFSSSGDTVTISFSWYNDTIKVIVRDSGCGIPADVACTLFNDYNRVDEAKEGNGLGLSLVRQLAHAMTGEVGVSSTLGVGSAFWFTLLVNGEQPDEVTTLVSRSQFQENGCINVIASMSQVPRSLAVRESRLSIDSNESSSAGFPRPPFTIRRHQCQSPYVPTLKLDGDDHIVDDVALRSEMQVLVVDNCGINRKMMQQFLLPLKCTVHVAIDGTFAIRKAKKVSYSVILMDNFMPIMNGDEAAKSILADDPTVPIIRVSADVGLGASVVDYVATLEKPFTADQLRNTVVTYSRK
jgi:CheY-like chemotaxis protein